MGYRERCVFCDIARQEMDEGKRLIAENEHFIAFEPYASKTPFETWLLPKRHSASFASVSTEEQAGFAAILGETMRRLHVCLGDPPYNYNIHTAPCDIDEMEEFHWHLSISPRLTIAAGFEMGTGIYINVTAPELAAEYLREADPDTALLVGARSSAGSGSGGP
jgi:UDPglucose--hexose-1-phosphate uridylyltransferase